MIKISRSGYLIAYIRVVLDCIYTTGSRASKRRRLIMCTVLLSPANEVQIDILREKIAEWFELLGRGSCKALQYPTLDRRQLLKEAIG